MVNWYDPLGGLDNSLGLLLTSSLRGFSESDEPKVNTACVMKCNKYAAPTMESISTTVTEQYEGMQKDYNYPKKDSTMSGLLSKIPGLNLNFGELEKGKVALDMNGNLAFRTKDSSYVSVRTDENGNREQVHVGDLKFDVPFYTIPTQELEEGDVVLLDGDLLIVQEKPKTGGFKFVNPISGATTSKIARTNLLNMFFYNKVVSMLTMVGGAEAGVGLGGLNPMTLMLLSGSNGGGGDIAEMLIMSQLFGGANAGGGALGGINPMMLMLMNKGGSGGGLSDMLPLLLMSQGANGANPFAAFSGTKPVAKKAAKTAVKAKNTAKVAIPKRTAAKKG